jgi:hypothetical protein
MNALPESHVTILVPVNGDLHLLHRVLGQLQTSEVKVVVNSSDAPAMPEFNASPEAVSGGLLFTSIQGL